MSDTECDQLMEGFLQHLEGEWKNAPTVHVQLKKLTGKKPDQHEQAAAKNMELMSTSVTTLEDAHKCYMKEIQENYVKYETHLAQKFGKTSDEYQKKLDAFDKKAAALENHAMQEMNELIGALQEQVSAYPESASQFQEKAEKYLKTKAKNEKRKSQQITEMLHESEDQKKADETQDSAE
eukprot:164013_1